MEFFLAIELGREEGATVLRSSGKDRPSVLVATATKAIMPFLPYRPGERLSGPHAKTDVTEEAAEAYVFGIEKFAESPLEFIEEYTGRGPLSTDVEDPSLGIYAVSISQGANLADIPNGDVEDVRDFIRSNFRFYTYRNPEERIDSFEVLPTVCIRKNGDWSVDGDTLPYFEEASYRPLVTSDGRWMEDYRAVALEDGVFLYAMCRGSF